MKRLCTLGVFVVMSGFAGCGSTSDDADDDATPVSLTEFPPLYADATCATYEACWGPLLDLLLPGEDCVSNAETAIQDELQRIEQAVEAGTVRYDDTKIQACLAAVKAQGCSNQGEPAECTAAIDGTVAVGGQCTMSIECAGSDTYCKSAATCPGTCQARETAGGACERNGDCAVGLSCSQDTLRCVTPAAAGDRCGGGTAPGCDAGLFCLGEDADAGQEGTCRSITEAFSGTEGEACVVDAAFCEPDLRCVVEAVTPEITTRCSRPVSSGAACKLAYPDVCPVDQYCAVPAASLDGICTAKPGSGQPCAARGTDPAEICAPNTRCDGGTCRPLQKLGGSCQADDVCYSGSCESGGCVSSGACQ